MKRVWEGVKRPEVGEVVWEAPQDPVMVYGWGEAVDGGAVVLLRLEVGEARCGRAEWPMCHRWVALVGSAQGERERVLVDSDTQSGVEIEGVAAGVKGVLVVWREGVYVGDEGRVVASWVGDGVGEAGEVELWRGEDGVGEVGRAAVAHMGGDVFWGCWVEQRGFGGVIMCREVTARLGGLVVGVEREVMRSTRRITQVAVEGGDQGQALLVWVSGGVMGGCVVEGGRCREVRSGIGEGGVEVASRRLLVQGGFGGYLVLWVGTDGKWRGGFWDQEGDRLDVKGVLVGEGGVDGVALGEGGFRVARTWQVPKGVDEPLGEVETRTGLLSWPVDVDGAGLGAPVWEREVVSLERFSLSAHGALEVRLDRVENRHQLRWVPWGEVEGALPSAPR